MIDNLIGAGEDSLIEFFDVRNPKVKVKVNNSNKEYFIENNLKTSFKNYRIEITVLSTGEKLSFSIEKILGQGGFGIVFKLKNITNNDFIVVKISLFNDDETSSIEALIANIAQIPEICKPLYQGVNDIDFVIYRYLGEEASNFIKKIDDNIILLTMIQQLYIQIYNLNINNEFHNDINIENSIITDKDNELYLIDFGLINIKSTFGTIYSICMFGCIHTLSTNYYKHLKSFNLDITDIVKLQKYSKSTDIVGFFNFLIDCFLVKKGKKIYTILLSLLDLVDRRANSEENNYIGFIKMLCFCSILSFNEEPYKILKRIRYYNDIIVNIENKLFEYIKRAEYIYKIKINNDIYGRTQLYTFIICKEIGNFNKKFFTFIHNLVINCYNSTFNLKYFNDNYDIMFDIKFLQQDRFF